MTRSGLLLVATIAVGFGVAFSSCTDIVHLAVPTPTPLFVVTSTVPASGASEIELTAAVLATLSKPIDAQSAAVTVRDGTYVVAGAASATGSQLSFQLSERLRGFRTYEVTVPGSLSSIDGSTLGSPYAWTFTTRDLAWTQPVAISSTNLFPRTRTSQSTVPETRSLSTGRVTVRGSTCARADWDVGRLGPSRNR